MQSPQSSKHPKSVLFIPTVCMTTPGPWAGLFGLCAYAISIDRARVDDGRGVTRARATIQSKCRGQSDCRITAARRRWILTSHDPRISPPPTRAWVLILRVVSRRLGQACRHHSANHPHTHARARTLATHRVDERVRTFSSHPIASTPLRATDRSNARARIRRIATRVADRWNSRA